MNPESKHRNELPLFDLPLHAGPEPEEDVSDNAPGEVAARPPAAEKPRPAVEKPPPAAKEPEPTLFALEDPAPATDPPADGVAAPAIRDRLLSALADGVAQVAALALAAACCYALGVAVTFADWMPFTLLGAAFSFLYWMVPLAFWGQTPGMAWIGHVAETRDGQPLTFGQAALRWLAAVLTVALAGLPLLLIATGRSLADRLSATRTLAD